MGALSLVLASFILGLSPLDLLATSELGCLVPLSNDQLSVDNFFVLFLLGLEDLKLGLL